MSENIQFITSPTVNQLSPIQLEALSTDPQAYLESVDDALNRSQDEWQAIIDDPYRTIALGFTPDEASPVALASLTGNKSGNDFTIEDLYIRPSQRGRGLGARVVRHMVDLAESQLQNETGRIKAHVIHPGTTPATILERTGFNLHGTKLVNRARYGRQFGEYTYQRNISSRVRS